MVQMSSCAFDEREGTAGWQGARATVATVADSHYRVLF